MVFSASTGQMKADSIDLREKIVKAYSQGDTSIRKVAETERVLNLRTEYWQKVQKIDPENLVLIDEMGVLLGLTRQNARSLHGNRVYDFKPFYRGAKVTVIGAVSMKQVLPVMTLNGSMNGNAFKVFVEKCLLPQLW